MFETSLIVLGILLVLESLVLGYVVRLTVRVAEEHEVRRRSSSGLFSENENYHQSRHDIRDH